MNFDRILFFSGSRLESGCLGFDTVRVQGTTNEFYFLEFYEDKDAIEIHKKSPHFRVWDDFKSSGGVESLDLTRADVLF